MSISAALSNALTGLTAAARGSQVVSDNVANALTEGFGVRQIHLSARALDGGGAGVRVDGISRNVDAVLLADRRLADAAFMLADGRASAIGRISDLLGPVEEDRSLAGAVRRLETALDEAAGRPDQDVRLLEILAAAQGLTERFGTISDGIQTERLRADGEIARLTDDLNTALGTLEALNAEISRGNGPGRDVSALEDMRQGVIDDISRIVPVREVAREDGRVALFTTGGAILIDGTAQEIGFTPVNTITADMTLASGALSGLTIAGQPVTVTGPNARLGGGALEAAFRIRDESAPDRQAGLDALAAELIDRFEAAGVDPSLTIPAPGLFTDGGAMFDPADIAGLAGRLSVNAGVDPARGGEIRRLRDGLGAALAGPVGDARQIQRFADALRMIRPPPDPALGSGAASFSGFTAAYHGGTAAQADAAGVAQSFAASLQATLRQEELSRGVDTDQQMQMLLLIERHYAANARVIETVDRLLDDLLAI